MDLLELDSSQLDIIREYQPQLEKLGVDLYDEQLQDTINSYPQNLETAIQAFIEFTGKGQIEKPTYYLIQALRKGWKPQNSKTTAPLLPVRTAADFDTGHTLEERIENYQRLCHMVKGHFNRSRQTTPSIQDLSLSAKRPDIATIQQFMADPILRPEIEKSILQHPEWGYEMTASGVEEIEF